MEFLATKGIEYLLVIGYLLLLVPFWGVLRGSARQPASAVRPIARPRGDRGWFELPEGLHLHRGHTWALPEGGGTFRVGMDDFAQKLLGRPEGFELPDLGASLETGEKGWALRAGGRSVDLLAPVAGEVTAVNPEVLRDPGAVCEDPYGRGWLLQVRVPRPAAALRNLLVGKPAEAWMEEAAAGLRALVGDSPLGTVMQDGGVPVSGFARQLSPEEWDRIAARFLLTE